MTTKRFLGVHNTCTDKNKWYYLLFYDFDDYTNNMDLKQIAFLKQWLDNYNISYILFSTKHGLNLIGLTPLTILQYAKLFDDLQKAHYNYYSGQIIRLSLKQGETQKLLSINNNHNAVTPLCKIFEKRFNVKFPKKIKMKCIYVWYRSKNP